jgi:PEP-CTERM motif
MTIRATYLATSAILALGAFAAPGAQAGYVVTLEQVGSNVVATGSGPIDLTGLNFVGSGANVAFMFPALGAIITGPTIGTGEDGYEPISGPASFGSGSQTFASSGSGDYVGISNFEVTLIVPHGYVSDSPLSDTSTYDNQTFASLGVTPGVYESTWGAGANQNFTLVIGASPVPEPSTWAMMLVGFAGLGYASHRASRKSAAAAA